MTVGLSEAPLVGEICRVVCVGNFNSKNLDNMAWAFATFGHSGALLLSTLARAAEWCVGNFKAQGILNAAWAFEKGRAFECILRHWRGLWSGA